MEFPPLPLQFHQSRWKSLLFLILAAVLCVGAFYMTQADIDTRRALLSAETAQWLGWAGVVLFGMGSALFIIQLFKNQPLLVLTRSGISQPSLRGLFNKKMNVHVPWSDISGISSQKIYGNTFLYIHRRDGSKAITVLPSVLGMKQEAFIDMIAYYQRAHARPTDPFHQSRLA
jgi:hypothetical protein